MQNVKRFIRSENGKLSQVVEYQSGARVAIPISSDGTVKWYEDKQKKVQK